MRLTLVGTLGCLWFGSSVFAQSAAPARSAVDDAVDSLFHLRQISQVQISPDGASAAWVQSHEDPATGSSTVSIYVSDLRRPGSGSRRVTADKDKAEHYENFIAWSPDSKYLAFLSDAEKKGQSQVYLMDMSRGQVKKLTSVTGALSNPAWSADGRSLAVLFTENAPHTPGPLEPVPEQTGVINQQIFIQRIALIDIASGKLRQVSPADLYIYEYDWSPDGQRFVATAAPGPGDDNWWIAQLYSINIDSSKATSILKPTMQMANPVWSPDGMNVAFIGGIMSDFGFNGGDIFTVSASGGEPRNLTPGRKGSARWLQWLPSGQILFTENTDGGVALASVEPSGPDVKSLWTDNADLTISVTPDLKTSAVIRDSFGSPPEIWAGPVGQWKQITRVNAELHPYWGEAKSIHWTSENSPVQGWLIYPQKFDPARKYPLVVAVHGGPAGMVASRWPNTYNYEIMLAAAGYFVLCPNPRGSYGQGEAFTKANVKDFGYGDLRDILAGVDEVLRTLPVDPNRIGVTGWSYGGFMTMWAVTQTDRFHAAVAGAGIANWQSYYGENSIDKWMLPYFGASVYDDPGVYARSSPITFIKNVKTPTLILVGERDGECPLPQSYEFWHALETLGVDNQFVVYPNEGHRIARPDHRRDVVRRAIAWFDAHLK